MPSHEIVLDFSPIAAMHVPHGIIMFNVVKSVRKERRKFNKYRVILK
jgi:hypothetical protein